MHRRKPKILMTTSTLPRFEGDTEPRFVLDLAAGMSEYFETTLLAPSYPDAPLQETMSGIEVIRYRYAPRQSWENLVYPGGIMPRLRANPLYWGLVPGLLAGQLFTLYRLLRSREFDIIHAHWTIPQGLLAAMTPGRKIPFVATAHGGDVYAFGPRISGPLLRFVLSKAAAVTAVSGELRTRIVELSGCAEEKVHCVPMGVDYGHFSGRAAAAARPADLPDRVPLVMFAGRLTEKKGVRVLIDAMAIDAAGPAPAHLAIVGEGPEGPALRERARRCGLEQRIHFLGARGHEHLPAYLAAADVFALPCVQSSDGDKDGLPVVLLEAAACGTPSVASDIGGIPQFIADGRNGLLVPAGEASALASALGRILADENLRRSLSAEAAATAEMFDWSVISGKYAKLLSSVLSTARRPGSSAPHGATGERI